MAQGIIQGIIVGCVLAFITANIIMNVVVKSMTTTFNGWSITLKCGQPGNGILLRAACAKILPATNVAQEAAYWTTTIDSAGQALNGRHDYILHFPAGQLLPNDAVLGIGRVLVESDSDVSTAYGLAKQIQLLPLNPK